MTALILFIAALAGFAEPLAQPTSIGGEYVGRYECNTDHWVAFSATLSEPASGRISGHGLFPNQYVRMSRGNLDRASRPIRLEGSFDGPARSLNLRAGDDLMLVSNGPSRRITLQGTRLENGYIAGRLDYPGCNQFLLVPTNTRGNPDYAADLYVQVLRRDFVERQQAAKEAADREARLRSGWVPPEQRSSGGTFEYQDILAYSDITQYTPADAFESIRPIDMLFQELIDGSHSCFSTADVAWGGTTGAAVSPLFINNRYVVECAGNCLGVNYRTYQGFHYGQSRPYPMIHIRALAGPTEIKWEFTRTRSDTQPPRIRIHHWSPDILRSGAGCRID